MNLTKLFYIIRILSINFLVLIGLWLIVEIINFSINPYNKESNRTRCTYDWILYNYCPNITDVKINTEADGGNVVFSYTNEIGQRVRGLQEKSNRNAKHVFIGDSFLQAEEMDYNLTFYGQLERKNSVTVFGYSSWNVIQYIEAIKKLSIKNTHYHVFLMPNDINPQYGRSVYYENRNKTKRKESLNIPHGFWVELKKGYSNSLLKKFILAISSKPKTQNQILTSTLTSNDFSVDKVSDCKSLEQLHIQYKKMLGYDYLVYSKLPICWSKKHKIAAEEALQEIVKVQNLVKKLNSDLTVYMIPPGWSFPNQNINGRKTEGYYSFGENIAVTTEPLLNFFATSLPSVKFISLESLIFDWLKNCDECEYYFPDDGHWTPEFHYRLSEYLNKSINFSY